METYQLLSLTGLPLWLVFGVLKAYQRFFQPKKTDQVSQLEKMEKKELVTRLSSSPDSHV